MNRTEMNAQTGSVTSPITAIIEAIAAHEGLDPMALEQPLYEVIDTDALDALVGNHRSEQARPTITVAFSYNGCRVHISGDGSVEVSPHTEKESHR